MTCDMIVILKDTDITNMSELVKVIEEKDGLIHSIRDINEKCHIGGIPCFYVFFSFSVTTTDFYIIDKEFKRIPYYVTYITLHTY